jgi:hypothetical protein
VVLVDARPLGLGSEKESKMDRDIEDGGDEGSTGGNGPNETGPTERQLAITRERVLKRFALVVLGKRPHELTEEQQTDLLKPFAGAIESFARVLEEVARLEFLRGVQHVHATLHGQPGVDHAMLDQAVEFHSTKDPDDPDGPAVILT